MQDIIDTKYYAASHQGLVRNNNEDYYGDIATASGHVYVVCDGMGGHNAGEEASKIATDTILQYLTHSKSADIPKEITTAIKNANKAIYDAAAGDPSLHGMGTTCVVLYVKDNGEFFIGHVGDSRIYIYTSGELIRATKDHSYVQYLVATGEITQEEAETHPSKNQILKALGIDDQVSPEVITAPIQVPSNTLFLLCSDGLSDMINDSAIKKILDEYDEYNQETVEHLMSEALNAGGKDNVTVGLLHIRKSPHSQLIMAATPPPITANQKSSNQNTAAPTPVTANGGLSKKAIITYAVILSFIVIALYLFFIRDNGKSKPNSKQVKEFVFDDSISFGVSLDDRAITMDVIDDYFIVQNENKHFIYRLKDMALVDSLVVEEKIMGSAIVNDGYYYSLDNNRMYRRGLTNNGTSKPKELPKTEKVTPLIRSNQGVVMAINNDESILLISDSTTDTIEIEGVSKIFVHPSEPLALLWQKVANKLSLFNIDNKQKVLEYNINWDKDQDIIETAFYNADIDAMVFLMRLSDGTIYQSMGDSIALIPRFDNASLVYCLPNQSVIVIEENHAVYAGYTSADRTIDTLQFEKIANGDVLIQSDGNSNELFIIDNENESIYTYSISESSFQDTMPINGLVGDQYWLIGEILITATNNSAFKYVKK